MLTKPSPVGTLVSFLQLRRLSKAQRSGIHTQAAGSTASAPTSAGSTDLGGKVNGIGNIMGHIRPRCYSAVEVSYLARK